MVREVAHLFEKGRSGVEVRVEEVVEHDLSRLNELLYRVGRVMNEVRSL